MRGDSGSAGERKDRGFDFDLSSPSVTSPTLMVLPFLLYTDPSIDDFAVECELGALELAVVQVTLDGVDGRDVLLVNTW